MKKPGEPSDWVSEFYRAFSKEYTEVYEEGFGRPPTEAQLQRTLLFYLQILFARCRPAWEVRQLFADLGPKKPRQQQSANRRSLAWTYGYRGKPPKLQFARWAATSVAAQFFCGGKSRLFHSKLGGNWGRKAHY